jgi:two-component system, cell cycle sensor histidine kinase and response regulator CckA
VGVEAVVQDLEIHGIPFANSPYPRWVYDRETRAFLEVNHAALEAYGFSREEILKITLLDIRPAEDIPEFLRQIYTPRPMGQSTAEKWRHKTKDGTVIPVIITSWEFIYRGRPAELVLARRERARAANSFM